MLSSLAMARFSSGDRPVFSTTTFGIVRLKAFAKYSSLDFTFVMEYSRPMASKRLRRPKVKMPFRLVVSLQSTKMT